MTMAEAVDVTDNLVQMCKNTGKECEQMAHEIVQMCSPNLSVLQSKKVWVIVEEKLKTLQETVKKLDELSERIMERTYSKLFFNDSHAASLKERERLQELIVKAKDGARALEYRSIGAMSTIKLPKLDITNVIQPFSGDILKYHVFMGSFKSIVDANPHLSTFEKFRGLRLVLRDEALDIVNVLPLASHNYELALLYLEERYGNKTVLITAHLEELLKLQPVKYGSDVEGLEKLCNALFRHTHALKSLGLKVVEYDRLLFHVVQKLLPRELMLFYFRKKHPTSVIQLINVLRDEIRIREHLQNK